VTNLRGNNPAFGSNKLKLGTFGTNILGASMTRAPEQPGLSWRRVLDAGTLADDAGFELIVPVARWKGFIEEKPAHRSGTSFDCYTWAAGLSQATQYSGVFTTSHVPTIHPIMAAKQIATIDHISGGRAGLNVVAGWNRPELEMFGASMRDHDDRYDQAGEWVELVRKLWTSEEAFDFDGKFYQVRKGISMPRPLQHPMPPVMNAGGSPRGQRFAAQYSDIAFIILESEDVAVNAAKVTAYKKMAREEFNREIQVWSFGYVVQRDSVSAAEEFVDYISNKMGDDEQLDGWMKLNSMNAKLLPPHVMEMLRARFKVAGGGLPFIGDAKHIAERLASVSEAGLDGIVLGWFDYIEGLTSFNTDVMPRLKQMGLRGLAGGMEN
jgi:dimethylsulfone monooxygenase